MSTYVAADELPGLITAILEGIDKKITVLYPFVNLPAFLQKIVQQRLVSGSCELVLVISRLHCRSLLAEINKFPGGLPGLRLQLRCVESLYNGCLVSGSKMLVVLFGEELRFESASFGWYQEAGSAGSEIAADTLHYVQDVLDKSHLFYSNF